MKVVRPLNNNVVIVKDDEDKEMIVCGKGIGFSKKSNDLIDEYLINKTFILRDETTKKLIELLRDIPIEYVELADEIVKYAQFTLNKTISDKLIISLSDHIFNAVKNKKGNIEIKNQLLWEIKHFYQSEFDVGRKAVELVKRNFDVELSDDEAGFMALHIVNCEYSQNNIDDAIEITSLIKEINKIVSRKLQIVLDSDSVYYYRFITHLKFFAVRILKDSKEQENKKNWLFENFKTAYPKSYECVELIAQYVKTRHGYETTNDEKLYLMIHIQQLLDKAENKG